MADLGEWASKHKVIAIPIAIVGIIGILLLIMHGQQQAAAVTNTQPSAPGGDIQSLQDEINSLANNAVTEKQVQSDISAYDTTNQANLSALSTSLSAQLATEQASLQSFSTSLNSATAEIAALQSQQAGSTNQGLWNAAKSLWDNAQRDAVAGNADLARSERNQSEELRVASGIATPTH